MAGRRPPPPPEPCPIDLVFPPKPVGHPHADQTLLAAWADSRWAWHTAHAMAGRSELGTFVDHQQAKTAARMFYLAARGRLDPRSQVPLPECWLARWDERPRWFDELPPNTTMQPPPLALVESLFED